MKRLRFIVFLLCFLVFLGIFCSVGIYHFRHSVPQPDFLNPSIAIQPESIDIDVISSVQTAECNVVVKNTGWLSLNIRNVRPSCSSCVEIVSFPQESIRHGKTGIIRLNLDIKHIHDRISTSFVILSDDPKRRVIVVPVQAERISQ